MRAVRIDRPGGYDRLRIVELPTPDPRPGEVLVETRAAGVNFADGVIRMGLYPSAKELVGWPITPGFEVSGIVSAVGAGVQRSVGQRVIACTLFGGYATHVVVPAEQVFDLPPTLSFSQGATFCTVFLTAWYALRELSKLRPGYLVLVHSAAGGVGGAALQVARAAGATPIGVVGAPHKVQTARARGASLVIDKSREPLWPTLERHAPDGVDVVMDANGRETLWESYRHLRAGGRLIVYGAHTMLRRGHGTPSYPKLAWDYVRTPRFDPLKMTNSNRSVMAFNLSYMFKRTDVLMEAMTELLRWLNDDIIGPLDVTEVPFEQAAEGQRLLESGSTVGKVALVVRP